MTGATSGFFCLDVDGAEGKASLAQLESQYGPLLKLCMAETPSDGWHIYFKMPDFDLRNSAGRLGPGLDVRANGGYVVVPPSSVVNRNGELKSYRYLTAATLYAGELPEAPDWLLHFLKRTSPAASQKPTSPGNYTTNSGSHYGLKALDDECAKIRSANPGTRNDTLNRAAFAVFQLAAGGELDQGHAEDALLAAALSAGLSEKEVRSTLKSALSKAAVQPRSAPAGTKTA